MARAEVTPVWPLRRAGGSEHEDAARRGQVRRIAGRSRPWRDSRDARERAGRSVHDVRGEAAVARALARELRAAEVSPVPRVVRDVLAPGEEPRWTASTGAFARAHRGAEPGPRRDAGRDRDRAAPGERATREAPLFGPRRRRAAPAGAGRTITRVDHDPGRFLQREHALATLACSRCDLILPSEAPAMPGGGWAPAVARHPARRRAGGPPRDAASAAGVSMLADRGVPVSRSAMTDVLHGAAAIPGPVFALRRALIAVTGERATRRDVDPGPAPRRAELRVDLPRRGPARGTHQPGPERRGPDRGPGRIG